MAGIHQMLMGAGAVFIFNQTISAPTYNYNLKSAAIAAGWDQITPLNATVVVDSGVYVGSTSVGAYSFDTGASFPGGTTLSLINNGFIVGMAGNGGKGGEFNPAFVAEEINYPGSAGGPSFRAQAAINVTNNGTIGGGGGGGGGGRPVYGPDGSAVYFYACGGGGGGGRGLYAGSGAAGGNTPGNQVATLGVGGSGNNGSSASPGTGGAGYLAGGGTNAGNGGTGGGLGSNGDAGAGSGFGGSGGAGGAGGAAVAGNANVNWIVTGTRLGAIA